MIYSHYLRLQSSRNRRHWLEFRDIHTYNGHPVLPKVTSCDTLLSTPLKNCPANLLINSRNGRQLRVLNQTECELWVSLYSWNRTWSIIIMVTLHYRMLMLRITALHCNSGQKWDKQCYIITSAMIRLRPRNGNWRHLLFCSVYLWLCKSEIIWLCSTKKTL